MEMKEDYWMEQAEKEGKIVVANIKGQISAAEDNYEGWLIPADVLMVITTPDSKGKRNINIIADYKNERIMLHLPYDDFKTIINGFINNGWWV